MERLVTVVDHFTISRLVSVAGATIWAYDYLLTFSDEVARIWPVKWSLVKALYMTNRYIAVPYIGFMMYFLLGKPAPNHEAITSTSNPHYSCQSYTVSALVMREIELIASTWLMMIRVRALYAKHRWAAWILYSSFIATHVLTAVFAIYTTAEIYPTLQYLASLRICLTGTPKYIKPVYFIQIPFEVLLLVMQLHHYWRVSGSIEPVRVSPLLTALYTDGVYYFVATVAIRIWAGMVIIFLDPTLWYMTVVVDLATSSTLISRVILHLGKVSAQSQNGTFPTFETTATLPRTALGPEDSWMEMDSYLAVPSPNERFNT